MTLRIGVTILVALAVTSSGFGQAPPAQPAPTQKTLAATINVFVFPAKGQPPEQQSQDEVECYNWAVQNTGSDPFELQKQAEKQKQQTQRLQQ